MVLLEGAKKREEKLGDEAHRFYDVLVAGCHKTPPSNTLSFWGVAAWRSQSALTARRHMSR